MVTKAQGDKVTLLCTFILTTADTSAVEIEWSILPPQGEEPVSRNHCVDIILILNLGCVHCKLSY